MQTELKELEDNEEQEAMNIIDNLRTIPGVSNKTIFALISECGDLSRFKNNSHFIGYLSLYPTLEQSGNKLTFGHILKRGAKLAKKALYQVAIAVIWPNKQLAKLFKDKVPQGRAKKEAVVHSCKKTCSYYFNNL